MIRVVAIAIVAAMLLPASADAAKIRFGGGKRSSDASSGSLHSGTIVTPRLGSSSSTRPGTAATDPARVPFPPANAAEAPPLRLTSSETSRVWCRSEVVVGGFCVLN